MRKLPPAAAERGVAVVAMNSPCTLRKIPGAKAPLIATVFTGLKAGAPTLSNALEDPGGAHAAADTHGHQAVAAISALELAENGSCEFGSGATQRVTERDRAPIWIYARRIESGLT